jgi:hypothetical protein
MKLSKTSLAVLVIQLALVSSVAASYLYQRHSYPRVWTRTVAVDPSLPMRGRYLSLQLTVDGCRSTLPSAKLASFPRNADGTVRFGSTFTIQGAQTVSFPVHLRVENGHLLALRPDGEEYTRDTQRVTASASAPCSEMVLEQPVDFFVAEHAAIPTALGPGQQLWIEVTIPPAGPPRPLQLALKTGTAWKPLDLR